MTANTRSIALLIGSTIGGGAERQFSLLARFLIEKGHSVDLYTIIPRDYDEQLRRDGIRVQALTRQTSFRVIRAFQLLCAARTLRKKLMSRRPDVIYSALPLPNLIALRESRYAKIPCVLGIRSSGQDSRMQIRLNRKLVTRVHLADRIISNSHAGAKAVREASAGNQDLPIDVVPNGIELDRFRFDEKMRRETRRKIGVGDSEHLVGTVGRFSPMKDYPNLISAFARSSLLRPDLRLCCVGPSGAVARESILAMTSNQDVRDRISLLEFDPNPERLYPAFDTFVLASGNSEGWPNVVGEAMASGVPPIVTDVGDSARIVGDLGTVVPPSSPGELATAFEQAAGADPDLRNRLRAHIEHGFSIGQFVERTLDTLEAAIEDHAEQ